MSQPMLTRMLSFVLCLTGVVVCGLIIWTIALCLRRIPVRRRRVGIVLAVFGLYGCIIANWLVWVAVSSLLGGSAVDGRIESGSYYLRTRSQFTHVEAATFWRLYYYELITRRTAIVAIGIALVVGFVIYELETRGGRLKKERQ